MEEQSKKLNHPGLTKLLQYVARTAIDGAGSGILSIQRDHADGDTRAQVLIQVASILVQTREYAKAAEVFRAAGRLSPNAALTNRTEVIGRTKRLEDQTWDPKDPATPVKAFWSTMFTPNFRFESLRPYIFDKQGFDRELQKLGEKPENEMRRLMQGALNQMRMQGGTPEGVGDLVGGTVEYAKSGDDETGYRIEPSSAGGGDMGKYYVLKSEGQYLLAGASNDLAELLPLIEGFLHDNKLKMAQTWMDWIAQDVAPLEATDELTLPPVRYLWSGINNESRGQDSVRVALASLPGKTGTKNEEQIALLKQAIIKAKIPRDRSHLLLALAQRHEEAKNWPELVDSARKLIIAAPKSGVAFDLLISGLVQSKMLAEAQSAAELRLKASAKQLKTNVEIEDEKALQALAKVAIVRRDWKLAVGYYDKLAKQRNYNESLKAEALWVRLLAGQPEDPPFQMADDEGGKFVQQKDIPGVLPRAMLFAVQGKPSEARERFLRHLEVSGGEVSKPAEMAVWAQLAEAVGELEESNRIWALISVPRANVKPAFADLLALEFKNKRK